MPTSNHLQLLPNAIATTNVDTTAKTVVPRQTANPTQWQLNPTLRFIQLSNNINQFIQSPDEMSIPRIHSQVRCAFSQHFPSVIHIFK